MTRWYSQSHLLTRSLNPLSARVKYGKAQIHWTRLLRCRKCLFHPLLLQRLWAASCFSGENVIEPVVNNNSKNSAIVIFTCYSTKWMLVFSKGLSFSSISSSLASSHSLSCFLGECDLNRVTHCCPFSDQQVAAPWNRFSFHIWLNEWRPSAAAFLSETVSLYVHEGVKSWLTVSRVVSFLKGKGSAALLANRVCSFTRVWASITADCHKMETDKFPLLLPNALSCLLPCANFHAC